MEKSISSHPPRVRPKQDYYFAIPKLHLSGAQLSVLIVLQNRDRATNLEISPLSISYFEEGTGYPNKTIRSAILALVSRGVVIERRVSRDTCNYEVVYEPSKWSVSAEITTRSSAEITTTRDERTTTRDEITTRSSAEITTKTGMHIRNNKDTRSKEQLTESTHPLPPKREEVAITSLSKEVQTAFLERWPLAMNSFILESVRQLELEHGKENVLHAISDTKLFIGRIDLPSKFLAGKLRNEKQRGYAWESGGGRRGRLRVADGSHIKIDYYPAT